MSYMSSVQRAVQNDPSIVTFTPEQSCEACQKHRPSSAMSAQVLRDILPMSECPDAFVNHKDPDCMSKCSGAMTRCGLSPSYCQDQICTGVKPGKKWGYSNVICDRNNLDGSCECMGTGSCDPRNKNCFPCSECERASKVCDIAPGPLPISPEQQKFCSIVGKICGTNCPDILKYGNQILAECQNENIHPEDCQLLLARAGSDSELCQDGNGGNGGWTEELKNDLMNKMKEAMSGANDSTVQCVVNGIMEKVTPENLNNMGDDAAEQFLGPIMQKCTEKDDLSKEVEKKVPMNVKNRSHVVESVVNRLIKSNVSVDEAKRNSPKFLQILNETVDLLTADCRVDEDCGSGKKCKDKKCV